VKRSSAYHGLSVYARCALIELIDRYTGANNGTIGLGVRELAEELRCSKNAASKALHELDDAKLAHPLTVGAWRGKRASEWRLTFIRCDKTGELPVTHWEPRFSTRGRTQSPHGRTSGNSQYPWKDAKAEKLNDHVRTEHP